MLAEKVQADHLGTAMNFFFAHKKLIECHARYRARIARVKFLAMPAFPVHQHNLAKAKRVFWVRLQVFALLLEPARRHHVVGSERTEILTPRHRDKFIHCRDKSLVRAMDIGKAKFIAQAFKNLRRRIRTAVVNDNQFKSNALLRHHGADGSLHELLVIVASHQHRHQRRHFALFRFCTLHKGLHVDILVHLLGKHVRYGVFHFSLPTDMTSAINVTRFSSA